MDRAGRVRLVCREQNQRDRATRSDEGEEGSRWAEASNVTDRSLVPFQAPQGIWLERMGLEEGGSGLPGAGAHGKAFHGVGAPPPNARVLAHVHTGEQAHVPGPLGTETYMHTHRPSGLCPHVHRPVMYTHTCNVCTQMQYIRTEMRARAHTHTHTHTHTCTQTSDVTGHTVETDEAASA